MLCFRHIVVKKPNNLGKCRVEDILRFCQNGLFSHSVWYYCEPILIGRIVIISNCIKLYIGKCLSAVCQIVFGLKQKDASSLFAFSSVSMYIIRQAAAKQEGLEINGSKGVVGVVLIYSNHRFVLEDRIAQSLVTSYSSILTRLLAGLTEI